MAIVIHAQRECEALRAAGRVAAATLDAVCAQVAPGVTTADIDRWVREDTRTRGGTPSQLGYKGFPAAVCTSRNEVVCHGIPSAQETVEDGDIINIDVTTCFERFHGDTSRTLMVGAVSPEKAALVEATKAALDAGIAAVRPGGRLGDVGAAIVRVAKSAGYGVVADFGGHGIGRRMHMPPHVSHVARAGMGPRLRPGMAFTIEPMLTIGDPAIVIESDGWRAVTSDGTPSAQFEHTVLVTESGVEVLTVPPAA